MINNIRHRHAIEARCCRAYDSGGWFAATTVRFHACPEMGAVLTPELTLKVTDALVKAQRKDLGGNSPPLQDLLFL